MTHPETIPVSRYPEAAHAASEVDDDDERDPHEGAGCITVPLLVGALVLVVYALVTLLPLVSP